MMLYIFIHLSYKVAIASYISFTADRKHNHAFILYVYIFLTLNCGMQPMWEDGMHQTSQSDDVDTSPGARLFNTWMTAMQIAISSKLNT